MPPVTAEERLQKLYDQLPKVACKGLCTTACGPLMFTKLEAGIIQREHETKLTCSEALTCSALVAGQCSVYSSRPYVCRAYGAVEGLECPFGCLHETGLMPAEESEALFHRIMALGGGIYSNVPDDLRRILGLP